MLQQNEIVTPVLGALEGVPFRVISVHDGEIVIRSERDGRLFTVRHDEVRRLELRSQAA